jgi:hypothetical protein
VERVRNGFNFYGCILSLFEFLFFLFILGNSGVDEAKNLIRQMEKINNKEFIFERLVTPNGKEVKNLSKWDGIKFL